MSNFALTGKNIVIGSLVVGITTSSSTPTDAIGLTVTINSRNVPMKLMLMSGQTVTTGTPTGKFTMSDPTSNTTRGFVSFVRDTTTVSVMRVDDRGAGGIGDPAYPQSIFQFVDAFPGLGTHTYKVQWWTTFAGTTLGLQNTIFVAYEMI